MQINWTRMVLTWITLVAMGLWVIPPTPALATSVSPEFVAGNPTCQGQGYTYGYKPQPEPPPTDTYTFPDGVNTVTITSDGTYFDWTSTLGIDAVIVKGGNAANIYRYDPPTESYDDTHLVSPNNASGKPAAISHIEFCYDYEVKVTKTATTSFTRTNTWTIDKVVTPPTLDMFTGDSGTVEYTITVDKTVVDSKWAVDGTITIVNPDPTNAATITSVSDSVSGGITPLVNCGVVFPYVLAKSGTLVCTYSSGLPDGSNRTNTATVATTGLVGGGADDAAVIFGEPTKVVGPAAINIDDDLGTPGDASDDKTWPLTDDGSVTYQRTFTCDADKGKHTNTATIRETGQTDTATVTVNCYQLTVTKDAHTSLTRTYDWTITKVGDQTALTLATGQSFAVNYEVTVSATSADSNWAVRGEIRVYNPAPIPATITRVADVVSGGDGAANVVCDNAVFPYELAQGATLTCTYDKSLTDGSARLNTATATLRNNPSGPTQNNPSGTTDFSGTANVTFDATTTVAEVDECITVTDDQKGSLGTVCANEAPKTFQYSLDIRYADCGQYDFINLAKFITNDGKKTKSDDHTVKVNVPCAGGCTLTQGYWKTHSREGPAPYDDAWKNLGALEEDTLFFKSGQTWYQVFGTPPAGNAYYNLAHQYMAAKLNVLNGAASTAAVDTALAGAEALFNAQGVNDTSLTKAERSAALAYASTLDNYNNGLVGPGHCSEKSTAVLDTRGDDLVVADNNLFIPLISVK